VAITEEYNRKFLFPMFLKSYYHLHPLFNIESSLAYKIDEHRNLNMFEMMVTTNKLAKELVNQELLIFCKYQLDAKNIKCPLEWWRKHKTMFPTVDF